MKNPQDYKLEGDFIHFKKIPSKEIDFIYPLNGSQAESAYNELNKLLRVDPLFENVNKLSDLVVFSDRKKGRGEMVIKVSAGDFGNRMRTVLEEKSKYVPLRVEETHHRAASFPLRTPLVDEREEVISWNKKDEKGESTPKRVSNTRNAYNILNVKGPGFLFPESFEGKEGYEGERGTPTVESTESTEYPWGEQVLGMFDLRVFDELRKNTDYFIRYGGRVEAIVGAAKIKACYFNGKLTKIDKLKELGVINGEPYKGDVFEAVEIFRLQRVPSRIIDLHNAGNKHKRKELLSEAFYYLNKEKEALGEENEVNYDLNDINSVEKYLSDSAYWVGKNLGILQGMGRYMQFFNSGNLSLGAGELIDLDSVSKLSADDDINIVGDPIENKKTGRIIKEFEMETVNEEGETEMVTKDFEEVPPILLKDIRDANYALKRLINGVKKTVNIRENSTRIQMQEMFMKGYKEGRGSVDHLEKRKFALLDLEGLMGVAEDISRKIILEKMNIKPIIVEEFLAEEE